MFEQFVKRPFHLALYRNGPYAEERSRFLARLVQDGRCLGRLKGINWLLLEVAKQLDLSDARRYTRRTLMDRRTALAAESPFQVKAQAPSQDRYPGLRVHRIKLAPVYWYALRYRSKDDSVRKNSTGVAMRTPIRLATARVKCFVLCVSSQSGLLSMAERSTGTSAAWRIR